MSQATQAGILLTNRFGKTVTVYPRMIFSLEETSEALYAPESYYDGLKARLENKFSSQSNLSYGIYAGSYGSCGVTIRNTKTVSRLFREASSYGSSRTINFSHENINKVPMTTIQAAIRPAEETVHYSSTEYRTDHVPVTVTVLQSAKAINEAIKAGVEDLHQDGALYNTLLANRWPTYEAKLIEGIRSGSLIPAIP